MFCRFGYAFAPAFGRAGGASRWLLFGMAEAMPLSRTEFRSHGMAVALKRGTEFFRSL